MGKGPPDGVVVHSEGVELFAYAGAGVSSIVLDSQAVPLQGGEGIRALALALTALQDPIGSGNTEQMSEFSGRGQVAELPGRNPEQVMDIKHAEGGRFDLAAVAQRPKHRPATGEMPINFFGSQVVVPLQLCGSQDLIGPQGLCGLSEPNRKGVACRQRVASIERTMRRRVVPLLAWPTRMTEGERFSGSAKAPATPAPVRSQKLGAVVLLVVEVPPERPCW